MTTLSYRFAHLPLRWRWSPARGLAHVASIFTMILEVFAESQAMARRAHRRYPFVDW